MALDILTTTRIIVKEQVNSWHEAITVRNLYYKNKLLNKVMLKQ